MSSKSKEQWRKILSTFDPVKNLPSPPVNNVKRLRVSGWKRNFGLNKRKPFSPNSSRSDLVRLRVGSLSNRSKNKTGRSVVHPSFNDEIGEDVNIGSIQQSGRSTSKINSYSYPNNSRSKESLECLEDVESEIVWSSSNESDSDEQSSVCKKSRAGVKNEKYSNPEYELNSFIKEIEKDLRRRNKIKQILSIKKGGYVEKYKEAVRKARADLTFLDYERRAGILDGLKGVVSEKVLSYGVCAVNLQFKSGVNSYFFLGKSEHSAQVGSSLISYADNSKFYMCSGVDVFIQPNKVAQI